MTIIVWSKAVLKLLTENLGSCIIVSGFCSLSPTLREFKISTEHWSQITHNNSCSSIFLCWQKGVTLCLLIFHGRVRQGALSFRAKGKCYVWQLDDLHLSFASCLNFLLNLINVSKHTMEKQLASSLTDWKSYTASFFLSPFVLQ